MAIRELKVVEGNFRSPSETPNLTFGGAEAGKFIFA